MRGERSESSGRDGPPGRDGDGTPEGPPGPLEAVLRAVARRVAAADRLAPPGDDRLLAAIVETTATVLEAQAASIALFEPDTARLVFVAAAGPAAGDVVGLAIDSGAGIAGYAFTTGQPLAVADVSADPRFDRSVADATGYLPGSLLATPLIDDAGAVGVLEALDRRGGTFSLRDLDVAAALARAATAAVRSGAVGRDATRLLRDALRSVAATAPGIGGTVAASGDDIPPEAVEALVTRAVDDLSVDDDEAIWRLADRLARLRDADPRSLELAIGWLEVLLRHAGDGSARGSTR